MSLSVRLKTIAALVPNGARVCDIGTDHALLPIFLIKEDIAKSVIATDLRPLPLKNAEKNIKQAEITNIELRLCDGLDGVKHNEADTVIIAGMGGEVISGIIKRAEWLKSTNSPLLILQPTTSPEVLRKHLLTNGFNILTDTAIEDNSKLYSVMKVKYTDEISNFDESYFYIGKTDPKTKDGYNYIKRQYLRLKTECEAIKNIPTKSEEYLKLKKITADIGKQIDISGEN